MDAKEFADALESLGFAAHSNTGQEAFGAMFYLPHPSRTVRKWVNAERSVPPGVETLVILMLERGISPAMLAHSLNNYRERHRRRRARPETRAYA